MIALSSGIQNAHTLMLLVKPTYTASLALGVCFPFSLRYLSIYTQALQPNALKSDTSRFSPYMAWCGVIPIRFLNVMFRASLPAEAALNQNLLPRPDSSITVRAIIMMELIVDSAALFCHCSFGVLKWLRILLDFRNCIISSDLYSEALSCINTTNSCLVRRSAMSLYHVLNALIASS